MEERKRALYRELEREYEESNGEGYLSRREIQWRLREWYPITNMESDQNDSGLRMLVKDIQALRKSEGIEKIIISNTSKGYKLANEQEARKFITKLKIQALKKLQLHYALKDKYENDGKLKAVYENEGKRCAWEIKQLESFMNEEKVEQEYVADIFASLE